MEIKMYHKILYKKYSKFFCFKKVNKKLLLAICVIIGLIVFVGYPWYRLRLGYKCYTRNCDHGKCHNMLQDIVIGDGAKPIPGKSIFFHETSCSKTGIVKLTPREACAIESAALTNPDWQVFTLFASPVSFNNVTKDPIIEALLSYKNINLRNVDLWIYGENTPLDKWMNNEKLLKSKYLVSHTSDYLRYLSMYRYGGVYLDLDVVVKDSFNNLEPNYAGAESSQLVAAGILSFEHNNFGHKVADLCLKDLSVNFDGNTWVTNGPGCITRVLKKMCGTDHIEDMTREKCQGFLVYPPKYFYAISYLEWQYYFEEGLREKTLKIIENSTIAHVWNKLSFKHKIKVGSNTAYGYLAEKYCPKVYSSCGEYF